jgi:hypothetical protein
MENDFMRFLILFAFLNPSAFAKTVVFQSANADQRDYRAFVLSQPDYLFPASVLLESFPKTTSRERLAEAFAQAQQSFVGGSLIDAEEKFRKVVELVATDHWQENDQTIFLQCYLRLAQLDPSDLSSNQWLEEALNWAPKGKLDSTLYPPPLLARFNSLRSQIAFVEVDLSRFKNDYQLILVNGERIPLRENTKVLVPANAKVKVTFLSNRFRPETMLMKGADLASVKPERDLWVSGDCAHSKVGWSKLTFDSKAFFSVACNTPLQPVSIDATVQEKKLPDHLIEEPATPPSSFAKAAFYERTWFWVGVGAVVATTVAISLANQKPATRSHPITTEGF